MLDTDLARLYGVATKNLNKAVERNRERFPEDFMSQLTGREFADLRFQTGTSSRHGGRRNCLTPSPMKGLPCCRACCTAPAPPRSI